VDANGKLWISLLGECQLEWNGREIPLSCPVKAKGLLFYLVSENHHPASREKLAGLFWPEKDERHARHSLSQALYTLQAILPTGPHSLNQEVGGNGVCFNQDCARLDLTEFDELLRPLEEHSEKCSSFACEVCLERLERAVLLYHGEFLANFCLADCATFEDWVGVKREIYRKKVLHALGRLSDGYLASGQAEKALVFALRQVEIDRCEENGHRQAIRAFLTLGKCKEALIQYRHCEEILSDDLGVDPEAETRELYRQIQVCLARASGSTARRRGLPAPLTGLIGRERDLEYLLDALHAPQRRLITLLGGGGSGKSHLALEVGRLIAPDFADGVVLVEVDAAQSGSPLLLAIGQGLGLDPGVGGNLTSEGSESNLRDWIFDELRERHLLMILDGFEGRLDERDLIADLLRAVPKLKILVTSRAVLGLQSEAVYPLAGLSFPSSQDEYGTADRYAAVELFLDVARRKSPAYRPKEVDVQVVAEICSLLEGLPLGIILAASWVDVVSPPLILEGIRRDMDFLWGDWGDLPKKQRSLRAIFEQSLRLLSSEQRDAFLCLGLFENHFSEDRSRQVGGIDFRQIRHLVNLCLLQPVANAEFHMHPILRQYCNERLATAPEKYQAAQARHSDVFINRLTVWAERLKTQAQFAALEEMDRAYGDILRAWNWAAENMPPERLENAVFALEYYHRLRSLAEEGNTLCQKTLGALAARGIPPQGFRLWLLLAFWRFRGLIRVIQINTAFLLLEQIEAEMVDRQRDRPKMLSEWAALAWAKSVAAQIKGEDRQVVQTQITACLDNIYGGEDSWNIAWFSERCARSLNEMGNNAESLRLANMALDIGRGQGDPTLTAEILTTMGWGLMLTGDYLGGIQVIEEQNALRERLNDRLSQAHAHSYMAFARFYAGEYSLARSLCGKALTLLPRLEDQPLKELIRLLLHSINLMTGRYTAVLDNEAYDGVEMSVEDINKSSWGRGCAYFLTGNWEAAESELQRYQSYMLRIGRLDMYGMPLAMSALVEYRRGRFDQARRLLIEALENGLCQRFYYVLSMVLATGALILAEKEEVEWALRIFMVVAEHPSIHRSSFFFDLWGSSITTHAQSLSAAVHQSAQEYGKSTSLFALAEEFRDQLRSDTSLIARALKLN
jgi:DNA-binding SARP family transcriptional activator